VKSRFTQIVAVHIFFIKNKKILLARRCNTGYEDGNFSVPAGHVEENEPCLEAAVRETKEEINVEVKQSDLELVHVMHRKSNGQYRIDFFFKCSKWTGEPKINEFDKCDQLEWFFINKLPNNVIPYIQQAIDKVENNTNYSELGF
jgi:ADP-ribose pyrophosphatase YjhB (NUDIX family)